MRQRWGRERSKDSHCKEAVTAGTGEYGHVAFTETTAVTVTNDTTGTTSPLVLTATIGGLATEIQCTTATGTDSLKNGFNEKEEMHVTGSGAEVELTGCTVPKPKNCKVRQPITTNATSTTFDTAEAKGVKFTGSGAEKGFTTITIENNGGTCNVAAAFPLKGTVNGTPSGATLTFTPGNDALFMGAFPVNLSGTATTKNTASGTPISITTE